MHAPDQKIRRSGYSVLELLLVVGIISILVLMYMVTFGKVLSKTKDVARGEALRQEAIGQEADPAPRDTPPDAVECVRAFRKRLKTSEEDILVSEMLYVVRNEAEFRAYWNTMLNPYSLVLPTYEGNVLIAADLEGTVFRLPAIMSTHSEAERQHGSFPVAWDFFSSNMADNTTGSIGAEVLFSDGHLEFIKYPGKFPMVPDVAKLTRQFVIDHGFAKNAG